MDLKDTLRPEILEFTPYSPGLSIDEIKERYKLPSVIKLASNENPLGASPLVQRVLARRAEVVFRYPQSGNPKLVRAIADFHGVSAGCVVPGNGSDEIIDLLLRVKARPGMDNVVAFDPCFSIYRLQSRLCGVEIRQAKLSPDFRFPFEDMLGLCDDNTALVFVTNPDNPSGYAVRAAELAYLAKALPPRALLVVDEAFAERFGGGAFFAPGKPGHWQFDLSGYVAGRLAGAGVGLVEQLRLDTYADAGRFFSFRRATHLGQAAYGRQISLIGLSLRGRAEAPAGAEREKGGWQSGI